MQFLNNIQQFLARLSLGQKLALGLVLVGGIGVLSGITYWAGQPDYTLLFGNLEPTDANKVVERLQADRVKYQLKDGGSAVYVPRGDVYELRLKFAGEGVISDGPMGYELFDRGTLGMTDFMQKLNLKRALEGELARTISNIRQVDICRVHLVMPERSPFRETQTQPSASVVLQLAANARLGAEQIEGITALVAGAVEGLSPSDVTVLDTRGNMLSRPNADDPDALMSSTQLRHQRAVEMHLTEKAQTMLDQTVGPGNAIVRVAATIDFSRSVAERSIIDPESATVIAEERQDQQTGEDNANAAIRNFELSRTVERSEKGVGGIDYLTVSVILNANRAARGAGEVEEPAPGYQQEQLDEVESLVKNAVGFNPDRGDRLAVHQTRFDTSVDEQIATDMREQRRNEQMQIYLRYGLMLLALAVAIWLLRSASRKVNPQQEGPLFLDGPMRPQQLGGSGKPRATVADGTNARQLVPHEEEEEEVVMIDDVFSSKLSAEAKARLKAKHLMFEEIKKQIDDKPTNTADLLRSWMVEDAA